MYAQNWNLIHYYTNKLDSSEIISTIESLDVISEIKVLTQSFLNFFSIYLDLIL